MVLLRQLISFSAAIVISLSATWAYSATPSTSKRMLAALPAWYRSAMVQTDAAHSERVEHEPVLAHA